MDTIYAQAMQHQQSRDPEQMFSILDSNSDGGIDLTELGAVTDEISEKTGSSLDVKDVFSTYDTDGNGALGMEEMKSFLEAYKPQNEGDMAQQFKMLQAMSSYGMNMSDDQISSLLDVLSNQSGDEDTASSSESESTYSSLDLIA
jgi:Ca2+-binding EF-hand superfamily protein